MGVHIENKWYIIHSTEKNNVTAVAENFCNRPSCFGTVDVI